MAAAIADEDNHDDDHKDLEVTGENLGKHDINFTCMKFKRMILITNVWFLPFFVNIDIIDLDLNLTIIFTSRQCPGLASGRFDTSSRWR